MIVGSSVATGVRVAFIGYHRAEVHFKPAINSAFFCDSITKYPFKILGITHENINSISLMPPCYNSILVIYKRQLDVSATETFLFNSVCFVTVCALFHRSLTFFLFCS